MTRRRRRLLAVPAAVVVVLAVVLSAGGCSAIRAGRVLRDALGPQDHLVPQVAEQEWRVPGDAGPTRVRLLRPVGADGPLPAFLLCHGAVDTGPDERRLTALGRAIAVRGATVGLVDLPALRAFRLDAREPARVAHVAAALAAREDLAEDGRVALLGISVGGSYAILAASEPELGGRASAVLAFGAYGDLERLVTSWMTEPGDAPELFDPLTEGRRLVLLGNLGALVPAGDRKAVERTLRALLRGGPPPPRPPSLGREAASVLDAAYSTEPLSGPETRALIAPLSVALAALSPLPPREVAGLNVHLLHGEGDPVVPVAAATELEEGLRAAGARVALHETDVFSHVSAGTTPSFWEAWPLLRFFGGFLDDAGL